MIDVGSVVKINGFTIDPIKYSSNGINFFYGVVEDWNQEEFGQGRNGLFQVAAVLNGDSFAESPHQEDRSNLVVRVVVVAQKFNF